MQQEERRPEGDKLLILACFAEGEVAEGIYRSGVSLHVRQPQQDPQHRIGSASTDPGEDEEEDLECEAQEHKDLDRPMIPEVQRPSRHCSGVHAMTLVVVMLQLAQKDKTSQSSKIGDAVMNLPATR